MPRLNNISALVFILLLGGCIKPYYPVIDASAENKYVISGRISNLEGWQEVDVSISSPVGAPKDIPAGGCQVVVTDDKGNQFILDELQPGQYRRYMNQEFLVPGISYKVMVTTPDGEQMESGFDKMPNGPQIDSIYYSFLDVPTQDPTVTYRTMQFYADLNAVGDYSQYYKWEVVETWEYHAARPVEYIYDGTFHQVDPPDYTNIVCYMTTPVRNVFTISTKSLAQNVYKKYPLHSIDGTTSRLGYLYSMLVSQVALSEGAYNYWEQLRINSNDQGGLYEKQPLAIKGNIVNKSHPDRVVLGYFYAVSEANRRYFYHDIEGIDLTFNNMCSEDYLGRFLWKEFGPDDYPVYFYYNGMTPKILSRACVDCRLLGGTTNKPSFWPK
jgi:hypothetical protein